MSAELDQCRREFEAHLRQKFSQDGGWFLWVHGDKEHKYVYMQSEWEAWQAAWNRRTPQEAAYPLATVSTDPTKAKPLMVEFAAGIEGGWEIAVGTKLYTSPSSLSTEDDPSHPRFVAGFKAGHAAGRARASTEDRELMERAARDIEAGLQWAWGSEAEERMNNTLIDLRTRLSQSPEGRAK